MKSEYDFSKGERGKFYKPGAQWHLPIYLDEDVLTFLKAQANSKGVDVGQMVNDLLRKDIDIIKSVQ